MRASSSARTPSVCEDVVVTPATQTRLVIALACIVVGGMVLQLLVAPWESPGGFYEIAGLWVAGAVILFAYGRAAYRRWTTPPEER